MSYEVIKIIKGNPYRYLVHSEREGDKVRQVFEAYLGRADGLGRKFKSRVSKAQESPIERAIDRIEAKTTKEPIIIEKVQPEIATKQVIAEKPVETIREESPFRDITDIPILDTFMKDKQYAKSKGYNVHLEYMSPDEYIKRTAKMQGTNIEQQVYMAQPDLVDKYAGMMESGTKFDMPFLDYKRDEQEGRARSLAAKKLGYKEIPVLIADDIDNPKFTPSTPDKPIVEEPEKVISEPISKIEPESVKETPITKPSDIKQVIYEPLPEGLRAFHAVKIEDLDKIAQTGNKIISPSFGITKSENAIKEYGDVVFGVPEDILAKEDIYTRDIWSPTLQQLPEKLIIPNKPNVDIAKNVFRRYGVFADYSLDDWLKDSVGTENPADYMRRYGLENDYELDSNISKIADALGIQYTPKDIEEGNIQGKISEYLFKELPKTPANITKYMKLAYGKDYKGAGSMFKGSQVSAEKFKYRDLPKYTDKLIKDYTDKDKEQWFESQQQSRKEVQDLLGLKQQNEFEYYPSDEMAGELANTKSLAQFKKILSEYGQKPQQWSNAKLNEARDILRKAYIDIPSEYFEAKSFKSFNINKFPYVITDNAEAIKKLKDMGYKGKIYSNYNEYDKAKEKPETISEEPNLLIKESVPDKKAENKTVIKETVEQPTERKMSQYEFSHRTNLFNKEFNDKINEASSSMYKTGKLAKGKGGKIMTVREALSPVLASKYPDKILDTEIWFTSNVNDEHLSTYATGINEIGEHIIIMNPEQAEADYVKFLVHELKHLSDKFSGKEVPEIHSRVGTYSELVKLPAERRAVSAEKTVLNNLYKEYLNPTPAKKKIVKPKQPVSKIPTSLKPLVDEALKYDNFDDFEKAFSRDIKHGRYYHITENPNFVISPDIAPRDMSTMAGGENPLNKGKLMVTSDLDYWTEEYKDTRKYVAIIDMANVPKDKYWQVNRGFGNEFWVDDPTQAKVIKVVPISEAKRDARLHHNALPSSKEELEEFYNKIKETQSTSESPEPIAKSESYTIDDNIVSYPKYYGLSSVPTTWKTQKVIIPQLPDKNAVVYRTKSGWLVSEVIKPQGGGRMSSGGNEEQLGNTTYKSKAGSGGYGYDTKEEAIEAYINENTMPS